MSWLLVYVLVIVVVAYLVWSRGRDRRAEVASAARPWRLAALIPLALQVAVFLLFGVGEMAGGDWSGAGHLIQVALALILAYLVWMRPLEGGVALLAGGVLLAATMLTSASRAEADAVSPAALILAAPLIVSGALFLIAGLRARREG